MKNKIIVAPLNWGLGHATRCAPIILSLIKNNITPIIASSGDSLTFLQKEFPELERITLPDYHITYAKNLKWELFTQSFKIYRAVRLEHHIIKNYVALNEDVIGIISDNRFGVRSNLVWSVYITHQINVLSGVTTFFTSKFHQFIINKFDACWVPDNNDVLLSGKLSSSNSLKLNFIGVLSRFKKEKLPSKIDVLVIISGPEPNRSFLEEKLLNTFKNSLLQVTLVSGKVEVTQKRIKKGNITIINYLLSNKLEQAINSASVVICRSGYSSVMDLAVLGKKVFFIPTKNQSEQEYLARYLEQQRIAPFCYLEDFKESKLDVLKDYKGFGFVNQLELPAGLFSLFKRK